MHRKRRVLFVVQTLEGGGAEQVAANWMAAMRSLGNEVNAALIGNPANYAVPGNEIEELVVHRLNGRSAIRRAVQLRGLIRRAKPDLVVSLLTFPNILAILATAGTKTPVTISEHNVPSILLKRQRISQRAQLLVSRMIYRRTHACVAVSHAVATDLMTNFGVDSSKMYVLPNQVLNDDVQDTASLTSSPKTQDISILVPARITWQKRPQRVLEIAEELAKRGHRTRVRFVGDVRDGFPVGELRSDSVAVSVDEWNSSWMLTASPDEIVVIPSAVEGFGNVFVEAAAARIRVVSGSSALGVCDSIVDGVTGILAPTDSVSAFADAVEKANVMRFGDFEGWLDRFRPTTTTRVFATVMRQTSGTEI